MSQIQTRRLMSGQYQFLGRDWFYEFGLEMEQLDEDRLTKAIAGKQSSFAELARHWDDEKNTEWLCRVFWAAKMTMSASLMLASLNHANETNLRVCVPYLQYYSVLYSLKSLVVMLPSIAWDSGSLITQTHSKTINISCQEIENLEKQANTGISLKQKVMRLKAFREFISYRAPSSSESFEKYSLDVLPICRISVELAQLYSEILEQALLKHMPKDYAPQLIQEDLNNTFTSEIEGEFIEDDEDWSRIGYLFRKHPRPANIMHILTEGHVESYFGSWGDRDERAGSFDPDKEMRILFDLP